MRQPPKKPLSSFSTGYPLLDVEPDFKSGFCLKEEGDSFKENKDFICLCLSVFRLKLQAIFNRQFSF